MTILTRCLFALAFFMATAAGACAAEMEYPLAVAAAENGPIYIADRNLPGVWKVADGKLELLFQASKKFRTPLNAVRCLAVDAQGRLYAGDSATREVYRFNAQNQPEPLAKAGVGIAMAIAFDKEGNLVVADLEFPGRVVTIPSAGGEPVELAQIQAPRGLAVDGEGRIWVVTHGKDRQVVRIAADGTVETVVAGRPFGFPQSIALDGQGNAYIADGYGKAVWKVGANGKPSKLTEGGPLSHPDCVVLQKDRLLVIDPHAKKIDPAAKGLFSLTLDGQLAPIEFAAAP